MRSFVGVASAVLLATALGNPPGGEIGSKPPAGMEVGNVSNVLTAGDGTEFLIFLPATWSRARTHPVLLFLHGVGGINNGKGCRNPGLTTQLPLLNPKYAAKIEHIVLVPVAQQLNWVHHFKSAMALVDMAVSELGGQADRVAVAGQGMGGHGAYVFGSQLAPARFCAVAVMCGYLDETKIDAVSPAIVTPLKSKPVWIFQSDEDDRSPPPGRPQDDGELIAKALGYPTSMAIKYTRYPLGKVPPNYIAGHAAFELAFSEEELWPWLAAQRTPSAQHESSWFLMLILGSISLALWLVCCTSATERRLLAPAVSTIALVASAVAMLGLMQSEGGMVDSCYSFSFFNVDFAKCQSIGADIAKRGQAERGWLALAISKARAENCFACGMGLGALYALFRLRTGTDQVAVVHLMHTVWACSVCAVNAQNAGMLVPYVAAEANIDVSSQEKLRPFVIITYVQAFLDLSAFLLTCGREIPKRKED